MNTVLAALAIAIGAYAFLALFANLTADTIIYRPHESSYRDKGRIFKIPADDGTPLSAIHLPQPGAIATVLYLHGNAEDLGNILPHLEKMQARGLSVLAFDYRGYGTTPGTPSERNVNADTRAVFRHLIEKLGVPPDEIVAYGRSLGSGPAIELAAREPLRGLILDGAFKSTFRVVTQVPLLPGDRFENIVRIPRVRCPVLVIHGEHDLVTPAFHGKALFAAAPEPKRSLWIDGAGHNDLPEIAGEAYWDAVLELARGL
ncbi:MAG: alpha/beta hydrolase [Opitutaceae bacterium]